MAVSSPEVKHLQEIVGVTADGIFGPKTLKAAAAFFNLTPCQAAHFFGQLNVETAGFTVFEENLNYSTQGLLKTFPKYFKSTVEAEPYSHDPVKIANRVYANRMGNGCESSYDGWKYRGRGAIQLTGKCNYEAFATFLGNQDPILNPDSVKTQYAFLSAFWYFGKSGLWEIMKRGVSDENIKSVTKVVNGGTNGLDSRIEKTKKYYTILQNG